MRYIKYFLTGVIALLVTTGCGGPSRSDSLVVIDAGHGGHDCGAQCGGKQEKELVLQITKKLAKEFKRKGKQEVRMYRDLRNEYVGKYRDRYLALRDGRPLWVAKTMDEAVNRYFPLMERGVLPYFLTRVLPEEEEVELLEVYDRCL